MNSSKIILTLVLIFGLSPIIFAQKYGKNYPNFEYKKFHFGAMLGVTSTSYRYDLKPNYNGSDSVFQIGVNSGPGFAIHIPVVSWNITSVVHLRTVPSITFHDTEFSYSYWKDGEQEIRTTRTQPTLLNFPLLLKVNTKRINNFGAYALGGFGFSLDLASQEDVDQSLSDPIVKLKRTDFAYHVGGGFDFFLPYFKFGLEIKLTNGIKNLLIQDETFYTRPLESLKSQIWWFSITFEG
ncbi:type IX secretion/gliding motility protein PorT/SprT [Crocinitomix algicola]|uniref:type IX secretion/gliding motility protein PorT/SprT n=1 Tax=Crocinitomix algicola TaxID=1740263 RepID=UPI0009F718CF|nr:outer membrane beta-barrel protein [Crocinitomix algicola]